MSWRKTLRSASDSALCGWSRSASSAPVPVADLVCVEASHLQRRLGGKSAQEIHGPRLPGKVRAASASCFSTRLALE